MSKTQHEQQIDAQTILEKYDRESQFRTKIGQWKWVVSFLGISLTVFHLYTAYFGTLPSQKQGAIHLGTALGIIFLLFPAKKGCIAFKNQFLGMTSYLRLPRCM
ncbi:hypothetical protein RWD45_10905 [Virgibacillus soli]|uniref:Uncharacterized protein n=1 Tax=Paracerasibacillus soli TaxID=480284 RepID=A0ABU5CRG8_9BACI|nr:hypothetical protein [Virgibacillus soli]MDY0408967.1 hypothetical protein [Virgibacillus soli]